MEVGGRRAEWMQGGGVLVGGGHTSKQIGPGRGGGLGHNSAR